MIWRRLSLLSGTSALLRGIQYHIWSMVDSRWWMVLTVSGAPGRQDLVHAIGHLMAGGVAVGAGGEQVVVPGVAVADGGGNGRGQGRLFQFAAARGPADAAAAASGGMAGNLPGPFWDRESTRLN